jgi:xylulokinase
VSIVAGVDSSTQSCKVVVCDAETGEVLRTGRAAHPDGTSVSADAWLTAYREATADPALLADVEAMSVGGQQHGMVTLDESGGLVRDALLWNDNRSASDAVDLMIELGGAEAWAEAVGSVPVAAMTVTKVRWLARNEPENAARTVGVVLPHDWLTWQIGGRSFPPATDRGDASGTCYFDPTSNLYRDDIVELAFGRQLELPRVAGPSEVVGETPEGIRLAPGTGDNMAAGLGLGLTHGSAVVSLGTSGTAFAQSARQTSDSSGVVAGFADATGAYLPLVCTLNGARNLAATAKLLGVDFDEFSRLALSAPAGCEGLSFIPYLEGERTPPLPYAKGELVGLDLGNFTPANIARAAIEGILWSLAYGLRTLADCAGALDRVILTGGAAQSKAVQEIAPSVLGLPVTVTAVEESVAIGAARQAAWTLTGELPDWPVPQQRELQPSDQDVKAAEDIHERYHGIVSAHYTRV